MDQGDIPGSFDRAGEHPLVPRTYSGDPAWDNLTLFGHKAA